MYKIYSRKTSELVNKLNQMERYSLFIDRNTQYCRGIGFSQLDL